MKEYFMLLLVFPLAWAWVGVAGNCAPGDYNGALDDVLREADRHYDVNIIICGEKELVWGRSVDVDTFYMRGGRVWAETPRYIKVRADKVVIEDLNLSNVFLILQGREIVVRDVNMDVSDAYCLKVVGDEVNIVGTFKSCEYGVIAEGNTVYIGPITVENVSFPARVNGNVYLFPAERVVRVEKIVERNVPIIVETREDTRVQSILDALTSARRALEECRKESEKCEEQLRELEAKALALKENAEACTSIPDVWTIVGVFALALFTGYLLGRT